MNKNNKNIISKIESEVKEKFLGEGTGHDWWHIYRVWKVAEQIGKIEKADMFTICLAALLHDIADWKFHGGDDTLGPKVARGILEKHSVSEELIDRVCLIISEISFKGAGVKTEPSTLEGKIVQDADRLDAIGAIGIARAFAYGGHKGRVIYDPEIKAVMHKDKEEYSKSENPSINHFYEKLLLLKDRMNTKSARKLAVGRHKFMEKYLDRFYKEWNAEL